MWIPRQLRAVTGEPARASTREPTEEDGAAEQISSKVKPGKILVVEDNVDSRDLLAKLLAMNGYDVLSASDGESGYAAALRNLPDLIITDINMPRMDGIALLKKVRLVNLLNGTAVFVITALGREAASEAIVAGADAAVAKPFDFDVFIAKVAELMFARQKVAAKCGRAGKG
ncbi:MAG TPA: response regulator [Blastocatellia bacterium]|nr:response regulator [Blastocatellia bacterium]